MEKKPKNPIKTAQRLFRIIEGIRELDGATMTELADYLGMAKSTVHNYLTTLESEEYAVVRDGEYQLSLKFYQHGLWTKKKQRVAGVAGPSLRKLAQETGELSWIIVEEHGRAVCIEKAGGDQAIQTYGRAGKRMGIHLTAGGKSILANLPDSRIESIIERHGLPQETDASIGSEEELWEEIETIRERGYALNQGETVDGIRAVGAPIMPEGEVVGGISVAGPKYRMINEYFFSELPELVLGVANEIELRLIHS
jgi:DNA-binding IclR family transcriptional regulator